MPSFSTSQNHLISFPHTLSANIVCVRKSFGHRLHYDGFLSDETRTCQNIVANMATPSKRKSNWTAKEIEMLVDEWWVHFLSNSSFNYWPRSRFMLINILFFNLTIISCSCQLYITLHSWWGLRVNRDLSQ